MKVYRAKIEAKLSGVRGNFTGYIHSPFGKPLVFPYRIGRILLWSNYWQAHKMRILNERHVENINYFPCAKTNAEGGKAVVNI